MELTNKYQAIEDRLRGGARLTLSYNPFSILYISYCSCGGHVEIDLGGFEANLSGKGYFKSNTQINCEGALNSLSSKLTRGKQKRTNPLLAYLSRGQLEFYLKNEDGRICARFDNPQGEDREIWVTLYPANIECSGTTFAEAYGTLNNLLIKKLLEEAGK